MANTKRKTRTTRTPKTEATNAVTVRRVTRARRARTGTLVDREPIALMSPLGVFLTRVAAAGIQYLDDIAVNQGR
jgi:hypothetical protein